MARPNVTVIIDDQSFVISGTESGSITRGGLVSAHGLVQAIGDTGERKTGLIETNSISEWVNRLKVNEPTGVQGEADGFAGHYGGSQVVAIGGTAQRWPAGPTGAWAGEWWAVHNFLQYGGVAVIGGSGAAGSKSPQTPTSTNSPLHDNDIPLDVVFCGNTANNRTAHDSASNRGGLDFLGTPSALQVNTIINIATTRGDCIAMVPHGTTTGDGGASNAATICTWDSTPITPPASEFVSVVWGNKLHLGMAKDTSEGNQDLVCTNMSADAAGCIARTDRESAPWYSPAGVRRGQILDVVRVQDTLTEAEQDTTYNAGVNPVLVFPGEGTMLFGDKTRKPTTSTLSRINVSRLFMFLKKTVGAAARSKLFEFNDEDTRGSFVNAVTPLLENIRARRGLYDYRVVCDASNNTGAIIDANQFVADIFIKPAKSINFIKLTFTNKNTDDDLG